MKRKVEISEIERTLIVSALTAYDYGAVAKHFNQKFIDADPTNDGPETSILRMVPQP
jgi:hypothetical protein